jgi:hypothetical protein
VGKSKAFGTVLLGWVVKDVGNVHLILRVRTETKFIVVFVVTCVSKRVSRKQYFVSFLWG